MPVSRQTETDCAWLAVRAGRKERTVWRKPATTAAVKVQKGTNGRRMINDQLKLASSFRIGNASKGRRCTAPVTCPLMCNGQVNMTAAAAAVEINDWYKSSDSSSSGGDSARVTTTTSTTTNQILCPVVLAQWPLVRRDWWWQCTGVLHHHHH